MGSISPNIKHHMLDLTNHIISVILIVNFFRQQQGYLKDYFHLAASTGGHLVLHSRNNSMTTK